MIFACITLAVSLSLDALGVGLAYGIGKIKIPLKSKLIICFFSIIYAGLSLYIGKSLSAVFPPFAAKFIGIIILLIMGITLVSRALLSSKEEAGNDTHQMDMKDNTLYSVCVKSLGITVQVIKNPLKGDIDHSGSIDSIESLFLGLALSVDAIGVGIGSAFLGFYSIGLPFCIGLFQLLFLSFGLYLGKKFIVSKRIGKKTITLIPGILLIFLALIRIRI
jgi:putative sporulation protein YtaF